jgi:hypothetical protein
MKAHRIRGFLLPEPGGAFYARIPLNGKRTGCILDTDKIREAQKRLCDLQSGHTRRASTGSRAARSPGLRLLVRISTR